MSAKAIVPIGLAVLAPVTLLFAFGGDDTENAAAVLDAKAVPAQYLPWVQKAGQQCSVISAPLIAAQIEQESGWNPAAVSPAGAQGISQFMPGTWTTWGQDAASKDGAAKPDGIKDPFTAGDAIMAQAKYDCWLAGKVLKWLKAGKVTGDPVALTLAAYNAGPGAVEQSGGMPNIPETTGYVKNILQLITQYTAGTTTGTGFGAQVIKAAEKWRGTPYSWGGGTVAGPGYGFAQGASIKGFDCSSLVQYAVYAASNGTVMLPRTTSVQVKAGKAVSAADIKPGDAIYFDLNGTGYDHVGIYVGNGRMIHAPKTGDVIDYADLTDSYYSSRPQSIRRFG